MSEIINEAVREALAEDAEDLAAFEKRADQDDELTVRIVKVGHRKNVYR